MHADLYWNCIPIFMICNYQKEHIFIIVQEVWNNQVSLYISLIWYCDILVPFRCSTPSIKFLSGRILNPPLLLNSLLRAEICYPVSTRVLISTPSISTLVSFMHPIRCAKSWGQLFPDSVTSFPVFTGASGSPLPFDVSQGTGWRPLLTPPISHLKEYLDIHEPCVPTPHIKNILSPCNHFSHHLLNYYLSFYCYLFHCLTVEGYRLQYLGAFALPFAFVQSANSTLQYCPSLLPELISPRHLSLYDHLTLTQPSGLLLLVEDKLSLHHHTSSTLNPSIAYATCEAVYPWGTAAPH